MSLECGYVSMSGLGICKCTHELGQNRCICWSPACVYGGELGPGVNRIGAYAVFTVTSLPIDLGLETDATEDDFGVWEVKTMVAVILDLLKESSSKFSLTACHLFSGMTNAGLLLLPTVTFSKRPQGKPLCHFFFFFVTEPCSVA